jgi:hypothetical protein
VSRVSQERLNLFGPRTHLSDELLHSLVQCIRGELELLRHTLGLLVQRHGACSRGGTRVCRVAKRIVVPAHRMLRSLCWTELGRKRLSRDAVAMRRLQNLQD